MAATKKVQGFGKIEVCEDGIRLIPDGADGRMSAAPMGAVPWIGIIQLIITLLNAVKDAGVLPAKDE